MKKLGSMVVRSSKGVFALALLAYALADRWYCQIWYDRLLHEAVGDLVSSYWFWGDSALFLLGALLLTAAVTLRTAVEQNRPRLAESVRGWIPRRIPLGEFLTRTSLILAAAIFTRVILHTYEKYHEARNNSLTINKSLTRQLLVTTLDNWYPQGHWRQCMVRGSIAILAVSLCVALAFWPAKRR